MSLSLSLSQPLVRPGATDLKIEEKESPPLETEHDEEGSVDFDKKYANDDWYLSSENIESYYEFFVQADLTKNRRISHGEANQFFADSKIERDRMLKIWKLCDWEHRNYLEEAMFYVMFHIIFKISADDNDAIKIPDILPLCLSYWTIERMRLNLKLKNAPNDLEESNSKFEIQKFKKKQLNWKLKKKKEEEQRRKQHLANLNRKTPEQIRLEKRQLLEPQLDVNSVEWCFNDPLGIKQGPFNVSELIISYRNNEISSTTILWKEHVGRHLNEKLSQHSVLYSYLQTFTIYQWHYRLNNGNESSKMTSGGMSQYLQSGNINEDTQVRRIPQLIIDNKNNQRWHTLKDLDIYRIWRKLIIVKERKNEGYLIQDTATMFIHNICYYYFAVHLILDSNNTKYSSDKTISFLAYSALIVCIFESILNSLGQFELKEKFIPYNNVLTPIAIIQVIFEFFVNLPMVIIQIYYLYYIQWNQDLNYEINIAIYVSFGAYFLYGMYKIIVMFLHHGDVLDSSYSSRETMKCCGFFHVFNWAICLPAILLVFGGMYFKNDNNDYVLSLVLISIGCLTCCCVSCIGVGVISN